MNTMNTDIHIALDLESVLAAIYPAFIKEYQARTGFQIEFDHTEWDHSDAPFSRGTFFKITASNWKHRWDTIEPTEPDIGGRVGALYDRADTLDIVTSRVGADEYLLKWLDSYDIPYDEFVVADDVQSKTDYTNYNVFIDDRPDMCEGLGDDQYLFVYDQPYNQNVRERLNVTRIHDLVETCFILERKFVVENPA